MWLFTYNHTCFGYLVNKPLEISHLPSKLRFSAKCSFFRQSLSRRHYQPIYQQAGKGFIYFITLALIFFAIKPHVNMVKKPVVI